MVISFHRTRGVGISLLLVVLGACGDGGAEIDVEDLDTPAVVMGMAPVGLAVLHAASERPGEARKALAEAIELGGASARQVAAAYPALAPYLK